MARNTPTKVKIALELEVDQQDYDTLASGSPGDLMKFLKANVSSYLHEYANGGLTLSGEEVDRIKKTANMAVESSDDIVTAVEKAKRRKTGNTVIELELDPAIEESFKTSSQVMGLTSDEFVRMIWGQIHANEWLTSMQPDTYWVPLTLGEMKAIQAKDGSIVTSADVVKAVRKVEAA